MNSKTQMIYQKLDDSAGYDLGIFSSFEELQQSDENLLSEKEIALKKLLHGMQLNLRYQEKLDLLLVKFEEKTKQNNEKLERINQIIALKNKRNKIQLKKKQIPFYLFEDPKIPPESFRILDRIRSSKRTKNFSNLCRNLIQGSSSDEEKDDEESFEEDSDDEEIKDTTKKTKKLGLENFVQEIKDQDPRKIDWVSLARKVNTKLLFQNNTTVVTGIDLYRKFMDPNIQKRKSTWTQQEDQQLLNAVKIHGTSNWKQIANMLDGIYFGDIYLLGKTTYLCFQRWAKFVNPDITKGRWKLGEDIKLVLAIEAFKVGNWIAVSNLFKNRTDVQCRERWCNILDPNLNAAEWTAAEDKKLIVLAEKHNKKWARVAKEFQKRTDNQCWRRWKYLMKSKNDDIQEKQPSTFNKEQPFLILNPTKKIKIEEKDKQEKLEIEMKKEQVHNSKSTHQLQIFFKLLILTFIDFFSFNS